jgi:hypothetical protein
LTLPVMDEATERMIRVRRDVWQFLRTCVWTMDQADTLEPIKQYPDRPYLRVMAEMIVKEPLLAIVKHRRMMVTWTCCAIAVWKALMREGRFIALVSKKEEDSDDLVRRCKFVLENIPATAFPVRPRLEYKYTQLSLPEINSVIKGVAQGPDQLRQYTCSWIVGDEIAFWPQARQTFTAMRPTIEGGGQITLLSTRYPGFFRELIHDELEAA